MEGLLLATPASGGFPFSYLPIDSHPPSRICNCCYFLQANPSVEILLNAGDLVLLVYLLIHSP